MSDNKDIKGLLEEQAKTFEAFKEANDEMQAQIKKLGSADAVTAEKVEKANAAITEIQERIEAVAKEAEETRKAEAEKLAAERKAAEERLDQIEVMFKRRGGAADDGKEQAKVEKAAEAFWADEVNNRNARHAGVETDLEGFEAYCKEFSKYLRKGERSPDIDQKALSVGVEADGGYWVKPEMSDRVVTRIFETSPMRQVCSVITIGTDALEFLTDPNDATTGGWVGEKDSRPETGTPQFGKQRIPVHEQYANPAITQKLLDDAMFDVENWLANKIADKLARTENTAFVSGNGVNQPRGFLDYSSAAEATADASRSWGVLEYVATGASAGFDTSTVDETAAPADELIDLVSKLKPVFRNGAVWLMSRATEAACRKIKDNQGNYVIDRNFSDITRAPFGFNLLGFPIVGAEDMPAIAANSFSIAFGNFREGYQIVDRMGIRTLRDPYTNKPYIHFYTTKRVGGDVVNWDAIKLMKFGTS